MSSRLSSHLNRRSFLKQLAAGLAVAPFAKRGLMAQSAIGTIRHATFGAAGMAWGDVTAIARHPAVTVVAACDVDLDRTTEFRKKFPDARIYQDYRELLDKERDLDTVNVSTPDHMHAPIGLAAMERGLHVYGQKPLTHDLFEARQMALMAHEKKVVTQMGIQIHSGAEYRTAVKLVQSGAIGKVREVHTWSSKAWGDRGEQPERIDEIPDGFNWDLWLGVCAERPFIGDKWYHPANWRKRLDFGTGTFGDMGCHPVFQALALKAPISVRSEGDAPNAHSWATDAVVHYVYPGTEFTEGETVAVTWYDGKQRPPMEIQELVTESGDDDEQEDDKNRKLPDQGSIFVGTKGVMVLPHVGMPRLIGDDVKDMEITKVEGGNHWIQFIDAALGVGKTGAHFGYAGPLSESVLLGSVASRFPKTALEWNGAELKFTNVAEANAFVRREYRKGWA